jgi:hypothetical protein
VGVLMLSFDDLQVGFIWSPCGVVRMLGGDVTFNISCIY